MRSRLPHTYPPSAPMALDSVPTCTSTRPCMPKWSTLPRPLRPSTPDACASSTIMMAPYFSASTASLSTGPMSPSIEKTPSVMTSFRPGSFWTSFSSSSQCSASLCRKTLIFALESRAPSMIDAWFSSSLRMKSSLPRIELTVPALAVNPDWKTTHASTFLKRAIFSSRSMWIRIVPAMVLTAPDPTPKARVAAIAASTSRGSLARPR